MTTTLSTQRLDLRFLSPTDASALQPILNDPAVRQAMGWSTPQTDAQVWVQQKLAQTCDPSYYSYAVVLRELGDVIGVVDVMVGWSKAAALQAELTIFLGPEHRQAGFGREALTEVIRWCFEDFGLLGKTVCQVVGVCMLDNDGSIRLLGSLLRDRGVRPVHRHSGGMAEARWFVLTREEYADRHRDGADGRGPGHAGPLGHQ